MNKKERFLSAMKLKPVDRIPTIYRGVIPFSKKIIKHYGIGDPDDPIILIRNHKNLLEALGADYWAAAGGQYISNFVPKYVGPELEYMDDNYFETMGIKISYKYLEDYDYNYMVLEENPFYEYEDPEKVKGFLTKRLEFFKYSDSINWQLIRDNNPYIGNETSCRLLDYETLKRDENNIISIGNVLCSPFILCSYLRGMSNFLCDLAGNIKMAEAIINEVTEFLLEFNGRFLNENSIKADVCCAWDDVASQEALIFSPNLFRKYFLPFWKKFISIVKLKEIIFNWHCCGNVNEVLPMMIDAGIDVFDVVQTSAKDMGIEKFYKKFGKNVCIHGGIDVQKLLIYGKPKDIKEEVEKIKELWGNRGGAIIGPSHEVLPETPIENVAAIYEAI